MTILFLNAVKNPVKLNWIKFTLLYAARCVIPLRTNTIPKLIFRALNFVDKIPRMSSVYGEKIIRGKFEIGPTTGSCTVRNLKIVYFVIRFSFYVITMQFRVPLNLYFCARWQCTHEIQVNFEKKKYNLHLNNLFSKTELKKNWNIHTQINGHTS